MAVRSERDERAGLDLPAVGGDGEIGDGGIFRLARAVRHHRGVAGLVRHLDGGQRLGQRADLVDLDQDRIGDAVLDALRQPLDIGDEQIVADELDLVADQVGDDLPALPIVLGHAVLDRDDGIALGEIGEILRLLFFRARLAFAGIDVGAVLVEFARRRIEREHDVARPACSRPCRSPRTMRSSAASADFRSGAKPPSSPTLVLRPGALRSAAQRVEDFGAGAQRLGEARHAGRHDHEFLEVDRIVGMHAAIDDVHHRHRQQARGGAADIAVERLALGLRGGLGGGERDAEDGIGAEAAFVGGAVERDHGLVDLGLRLGVHAAERLENLAVDRLDRLAHALAAVAGLVAVAQFHRLMHAGGGAGGHRGAAERAVLQDDVDFDGRIAAAVEDFAADDVGDGGHEGCSRRGLGGLLQDATTPLSCPGLTRAS